MCRNGFTLWIYLCHSMILLLKKSEYIGIEARFQNCNQYFILYYTNWNEPQSLSIYIDNSCISSNLFLIWKFEWFSTAFRFKNRYPWTVFQARLWNLTRYLHPGHISCVKYRCGVHLMPFLLQLHFITSK